jgi:hypothetical protein
MASMVSGESFVCGDQRAEGPSLARSEDLRICHGSWAGGDGSSDDGSGDVLSKILASGSVSVVVGFEDIKMFEGRSLALELDLFCGGDTVDGRLTRGVLLLRSPFANSSVDFAFAAAGFRLS